MILYDKDQRPDNHCTQTMLVLCGYSEKCPNLGREYGWSYCKADKKDCRFYYADDV